MTIYGTLLYLNHTSPDVQTKTKHNTIRFIRLNRYKKNNGTLNISATVQTSHLTRAECNANEQNLLFEFICIRFGTVRHDV
jgi:hypothetical protein